MEGIVAGIVAASFHSDYLNNAYQSLEIWPFILALCAASQFYFLFLTGLNYLVSFS